MRLVFELRDNSWLSKA